MSELNKRILSGLAMAAVLLGDLWLGSWWYLALLAVGGLIVFREFVRLVRSFATTNGARTAWIVSGALYISAAFAGLWLVRAIPGDGFFYASWLFLIVWATDVGAYAFGRLIGGPKIAPMISPSKTWAGLVGGTVCATALAIYLAMRPSVGMAPNDGRLLIVGLALGGMLAVLAQCGDFFESWMKRKAGVKDSGGIIPGHGGLFDRVDGLLPVAIVFPWLLGLVR